MSAIRADRLWFVEPENRPTARALQRNGGKKPHIRLRRSGLWQCQGYLSDRPDVGLDQTYVARADTPADAFELFAQAKRHYMSCMRIA